MHRRPAGNLVDACSALRASAVLRPALLMKLLDAGAYGLIFPMVNYAAEAKALIRTRHPPRGSRSFGPARGLLDGGSTILTARTRRSSACRHDRNGGWTSTPLKRFAPSTVSTAFLSGRTISRWLWAIRLRAIQPRSKLLQLSSDAQRPRETPANTPGSSALQARSRRAAPSKASISRPQ